MAVTTVQTAAGVFHAVDALHGAPSLLEDEGGPIGPPQCFTANPASRKRGRPERAAAVLRQNEKAPEPEAPGPFEWAILDSNQRPLPCDGSALAS